MSDEPQYYVPIPPNGYANSRAADIMRRQIDDLRRNRAELQDWLIRAGLARLEGWRLVEERSPDGLRTRWYFEQWKQDAKP